MMPIFFWLYNYKFLDNQNLSIKNFKFRKIVINTIVLKIRTIKIPKIGSVSN